MIPDDKTPDVYLADCADLANSIMDCVISNRLPTMEQSREAAAAIRNLINMAEDGIINSDGDEPEADKDQPELGNLGDDAPGREAG